VNELGSQRNVWNVTVKGVADEAGTNLNNPDRYLQEHQIVNVPYMMNVLKTYPKMTVPAVGGS